MAVVTGASQGIGRAVCQRLAGLDYSVWALARRGEPLLELAASCPEGSVRPFPCDITAPSFSGLTEALAQELRPGSLRTLVHCAGIMAAGPVTTAGLDQFDAVMATNALGPLRLTSELLPLMGPGSTVVFVNSSQGTNAGAGAGGYAASKHALKAIADSLRHDLVGSGIRVTSLYPGRTATPMQEALYRARRETYQPDILIQPSTIAEVVAGVVGLAPEAEITDVSLRPSAKSY